MGSRLKPVMASAAAVLLALVGCSPPPSTTTSITVFASSSLISTFGEIGKRFKAENPDASVEFIFANSSDLAAQLVAGTRADVFASADSNKMATVVDADQLAWGPVSFASNTLVIAVAPGNPKMINSLADLHRPGVNVALCAPPGMCAADTQRIEDSTGIKLAPTSEQSSVNGVLNAVGSGQADAGLVYLTDATAAGNKVSSVSFPQAASAVNTYTIGLLKGSEQPELARRFIDLVTEEPGQQILNQAGFGAAPPTSGTNARN